MRHNILKVVLAVLLITCTVASGDEAFSDLGIARPRISMEAPGFTLDSIDGKRSGLADFKGRVILLHFWATWCRPCRDEMPAMERLWKMLKDKGFVVMAVSVDRGDPKRVASFSRRYSLSFPILLDREGEVRRTYEVAALPTSYIIGRDGRIIGRIIGSREWDGAASIRFFEALLGR